MKHKKVMDITYSILIFVFRFIVVAAGMLNILRVTFAAQQFSSKLPVLQTTSFLLLLGLIFLKIKFCKDAR